MAFSTSFLLYLYAFLSLLFPYHLNTLNRALFSANAAAFAIIQIMFVKYFTVFLKHFFANRKNAPFRTNARANAAGNALIMVNNRHKCPPGSGVIDSGCAWFCM
jgi:hypothetical protein